MRSLNRRYDSRGPQAGAVRQTVSPGIEAAIANSVAMAEKIMRKIDALYPAKSNGSKLNRFRSTRDLQLVQFGVCRPPND
jgi:hypothetical protein